MTDSASWPAWLDAAWAVLGPHGLGTRDLLGLFGHYLLLSLLAVGGAITTAPEMQRYLVLEQGWLDHAGFNSAVAIAQAAPGPNILFVPLLGWQVAGVAGMLATLAGILLPASVLALQFGRYGRRHAQSLWMQAFTLGMTPLTLGLLLATGWLLAAPAQAGWASLGLVAATVLLNMRTRLNPVWLIALGGLAGAFGLV